MKKFFVSLFLIIAMFVIGLSPVESQVVQPAYKDGDQWVYRLTKRKKGSNLPDGDYKITYQNGEHEGDHALFLKLIATVNIQGNEIKWFDFPLKPGKKWKFSHKKRFLTGEHGYRTIWIEANVEVVGPKPVNPEAGKFTDAIEIRRKDTGQKRDWEFKYFYSPVAKSVVKFLAFRANRKGKIIKLWEVELIKYSVK